MPLLDGPDIQRTFGLWQVVGGERNLRFDVTKGSSGSLHDCKRELAESFEGQEESL